MELAKLKNYNQENNTRCCKTCEKWLDLSEFSTRITKRHKNIQYRDVCKKCSVKSVQKTKYCSSEYRKKLRVKDSRKTMITHAKKRALLNNLDFDLRYDDIIIPNTCPLLNIPIFVCTSEMTGRSGPCDNSPSLDRINNNKGYTKSNVWVISHRANSLKRDSSLEELQLLVNNLKAVHVKSDELLELHLN